MVRVQSKFSNVIVDALMALPSMDIDNDNIIVTEIDYFKILPSVQWDADLFEDKFEVEEPELEEFDAASHFDEALTQD